MWISNFFKSKREKLQEKIKKKYDKEAIYYDIHRYRQNNADLRNRSDEDILNYILLYGFFVESEPTTTEKRENTGYVVSSDISSYVSTTSTSSVSDRDDHNKYNYSNSHVSSSSYDNDSYHSHSSSSSYGSSSSSSDSYSSSSSCD